MNYATSRNREQQFRCFRSSFRSIEKESRMIERDMIYHRCDFQVHYYVA